MPKVSEDHKNGRREEIIQACAKLYETMGFREITLKEIGQATSFSRPSIYNYFKTKEEIFLGLLTQEYEYWTQDLLHIVDAHETLTKEEVADKIARTLEKRENLLKISAMNLYEIEENSAIERLQEYKVAFRSAMNAVFACVDKFIPVETEEKKLLIQYGFFPFTYGVYPYTKPTEKQKEAMDTVGVEFKAISVYEMLYQFLLQLFK